MAAHAQPLLLCALLAPFCSAAAQLPAPTASFAVPAGPSEDLPRRREQTLFSTQSTLQQLEDFDQPGKAASASSMHEFAPASSASGKAKDSADPMSHAMIMMTLSEPFIVSNATVRGPVSAQQQDQLEAEEQAHPRSTVGAFRSLLHGAKAAQKYPKCGRCRMVQCGMRGRRRYCSGHCRQKQKLFFCDTFRVASFFCMEDEVQPTLEEVKQRPVSNMGEYDTVVVTAEAPYIGCADIANRPSGCPARGTRANIPGRPELEVVSTECLTEYYVPNCDAPLFPVGVCECFYREPRTSRGFLRFFRRQRTIRGPCRTTELPAGSGVGGADGSPSDDDLVVVPGDDVTQTSFSNFTDPGQRPTYVYDVTAFVGSAGVDVSLSFFRAELLYSDYLQSGSQVPEGYEEDYEAAPAGEVYDYSAFPRLQDYEFTEYNYSPAQEGVEGVEGT